MVTFRFLLLLLSDQLLPSKLVFSYPMFKPKYPQPFSLAEALDLDPSVITEGEPTPPCSLTPLRPSSPSLSFPSCDPSPLEITRLQNSLGHLHISNHELLRYLETEGEDPDLRDSVKENELTMHVDSLSLPLPFFLPPLTLDLHSVLAQRFPRRTHRYAPSRLGVQDRRPGRQLALRSSSPPGLWSLGDHHPSVASRTTYSIRNSILSTPSASGSSSRSPPSLVPSGSTARSASPSSSTGRSRRGGGGRRRVSMSLCAAFSPAESGRFWFKS